MNLGKIKFNEYGYLENGDYNFSLTIIQSELLFSKKRNQLFENFKHFLNKYYCERKIIDEIFLIGSFISKKENPSDIDLAIKLNENIKIKISPIDSIFDHEYLKENYSLEIVFIKPESLKVNAQLPNLKFANPRLTGFRRLKLEEIKKISIEESIPPYEFQKNVKGVIKLDLKDYCV